MNAAKIKELIEKIKASEPIKLNIKGVKNNTPRPIHYHNSRKQYIPSVVARFEGKRDIYEFEDDITEKEISELTFKWILFSSEARKFGGKFYLVINEAHSALCESVIRDKQLEIKLIEF